MVNNKSVTLDDLEIAADLIYDEFKGKDIPPIYELVIYTKSEFGFSEDNIAKCLGIMQRKYKLRLR